MSILTLIYAAIPLLLTVFLVKSLRSAVGRTEYVQIIKGVRWWMVPLALLTFVCVLMVAILLSRIPYSDVGLWKLFGGSGGNVLTGPGSSGVSHGSGSDPVMVFLTFATPVMLLLCVPILALREERVFREFSECRSLGGRFRVALVFGLTHMFMGIPLYMALALTVGGLFFTSVYMRALKRRMAERGWSLKEEGVPDAFQVNRALFLMENEIELKNRDAENDRLLVDSLRDTPAVDAARRSVREATFVATSAHVVYNSMLVTLLLGLLTATFTGAISL